MYTFGHHIKDTVKKCKGKINAIKSLAGTSWGQDKETLLITYKAVVRSTLEYGTPIWSPTISPTSWTKLQTIQNQGLRTASGCLLMSSQEHIHRECKVLPVKDHSVLLTKQHTAGCILETSPGNRLLGLPLPQRNLKPTHLAHLPEVREKFRGSTHKDVIKSLHTTAVASTLSTYQVNRVLQDTPPDINPEEKQLPRGARSELARLRSGFSRNLNSYLHRLDESVPDTCPDCNIHQHTTNHLFNCTSNPTDLEPIHLWTQPRKSAQFLKLLPHDDDDEG